MKNVEKECFKNTLLQKLIFTILNLILAIFAYNLLAHRISSRIPMNSRLIITLSQIITLKNRFVIKAKQRKKQTKSYFCVFMCVSGSLLISTNEGICIFSLDICTWIRCTRDILTPEILKQRFGSLLSMNKYLSSFSMYNLIILFSLFK